MDIDYTKKFILDWYSGLPLLNHKYLKNIPFILFLKGAKISKILYSEDAKRLEGHKEIPFFHFYF